MLKYEISLLNDVTMKAVWKELASIDEKHVEAGLLELWQHENYVSDLVDKWSLSYYIHDTDSIWGYKIVSGRGKIVGYSHSHRTSILPCYRRMGLGQVLLACSVKKSIENGYKGMTVLIDKRNEPNRNFMKKMNGINTGIEINNNELWKLDF